MSGDFGDSGGRERKEVVKLQQAPDGGWGWIVVFGSFMVHVITDGVTYSFGVFYDEFLTYFKEGKGPTAWILSILVGVTLCSGPISSLMVNRWGCRTVTITGSVLASLCMVISIWANSIFVLYITIGIGAGLGFGLIYLPAIVSVSMYFERKRSLATGIAVCGSGFGTFLFAPIITKLLSLYGWREAMLIIAGIVMLCAAFGALFTPLPEESVEDEYEESSVCFTKNLYVDDDEAQYMKRSFSSNEVATNNFANYGAIHKSEADIYPASKSDCGMRSQIRRSKSLFSKPDIFYQGSLASIPDYEERKDDEQHILSCKDDTQSTSCWGLDDGNLDLFKDVVFVVFVISNFLTSIGFNIPYVYIISRAKKLGISSEDAGLLLAVIGIANTVGRIILGYISDKAWVNRLLVYNVCLTLCGIATMLSGFCVDFYSLVLYSIVFGFTIGAYVGLTSVILVDLLGLDKLTNAFGILLLFQGIASFIGPPIAGQLYDKLKSYDPGFFVAGAAIALSGLILFTIPPIRKWKSRNEERVALLLNF